MLIGLRPRIIYQDSKTEKKFWDWNLMLLAYPTKLKRRMTIQLEVGELSLPKLTRMPRY